MLSSKVIGRSQFYNVDDDILINISIWTSSKRCRPEGPGGYGINIDYEEAFLTLSLSKEILR